MSTKDRDYYRTRALKEREIALKSANRDVAEIHAELARQYDALVDQAELRPKLGIKVRGRLTA